MPTRRPSLSDRLTPPAESRGADAYFGSSPTRKTRPSRSARETDAGQPETVSPVAEAPQLDDLLAQPGRRSGPKWDEANQRASYYLPVDLLRELDAVATPALSKSQIVTAALQQYLRATGRRRA